LCNFARQSKNVKMKTNWYYFKAGFIRVAIFMFAFTFVRGLFDGNFSSANLLRLLILGVLAGTITGSLLGFTNMLLWKKDNIFSNKKTDNQ
jgi:hypothetical protein